MTPERESKSISVEDTFERDLTDPALLGALAERMAARVAERLVTHRLSGRTVTLKARLYDFTTLSRSATLPGPTDDVRAIARLARRLLSEIDASGGIRLLGVGVSGLSDWVQDDLFAAENNAADQSRSAGEAAAAVPDEAGVAGAGDEVDALLRGRRWVPGMDVVHTELGAGWVWGSGRGRVTVRFETADTPAGPVRTFPDDDPALSPT